MKFQLKTCMNLCCDKLFNNSQIIIFSILSERLVLGMGSGFLEDTWFGEVPLIGKVAALYRLFSLNNKLTIYFLSNSCYVS